LVEVSGRVFDRFFYGSLVVTRGIEFPSGFNRWSQERVFFVLLSEAMLVLHGFLFDTSHIDDLCRFFELLVELLKGLGASAFVIVESLIRPDPRREGELPRLQFDYRTAFQE
jgi:hypothetical protein